MKYTNLILFENPCQFIKKCHSMKFACHFASYVIASKNKIGYFCNFKEMLDLNFSCMTNESQRLTWIIIIDITRCLRNIF